jgi:hypothetical protein
MPDAGSSSYFGTRACADYVNDVTDRLTVFVTTLEMAGEDDTTFRGWFDRQVAESLLTGTVDGFLTYLADLLAMVYETSPNALPAEANIPVSLALELDDRVALARELAGRRVRHLARQGIDALKKPFNSMQFPLVRSAEEGEAIERALAQRELVIHSRGIVDRAYLRRVPDARATLGEELEVGRREAVEDVLELVEAAIRVDQAAVEQWGFDTVEILLGASMT